jgi:hypothetical protein
MLTICRGMYRIFVAMILLNLPARNEGHRLSYACTQPMWSCRQGEPDMFLGCFCTAVRFSDWPRDEKSGPR